MPHSSGGGSHSGGFHGGSHHGSHGGSSGRNNRKHASTYFDGARHYVYYKKKKPVHFYSDVKITKEYIKKRKRIWCLIQLTLAIFYLGLFAVIFFTGVYRKPHKLSPPCLDDNRIIDTITIINDGQEKQIMGQLEEFRELTGISVTILTVYDSVWYGNFATLENYAYNYYVTNLQDEKNWLLVYSEPDHDSAFMNWKWEGMQGDDTDFILTTKSLNKFNQEMHKNITKEGFAQALIKTFDYYNDIVMETSFQPLVLIASFLGIGLHAAIFFGVFYALYGSSIKIDEKAVELANPQYSYIEDTCSYCGGLYIHGIHSSCPHCGGVIEPLDRPIMIKP